MTILSSGSIVSYQGYAGKNVLTTVKFNGVGQDPLDNTYYTYSVDTASKRAELMAYLENQSNLTVISYLDPSDEIGNTAHADAPNYSARYPSLKGDQVGIVVLSGSLAPAQSFASTGVDVAMSGSTTVYTAYFSNTSRVWGSGGTLNTYYTAQQALSGGTLTVPTWTTV